MERVEKFATISSVLRMLLTTTNCINHYHHYRAHRSDKCIGKHASASMLTSGRQTYSEWKGRKEGKQTADRKELLCVGVQCVIHSDLRLRANTTGQALTFAADERDKHFSKAQSNSNSITHTKTDHHHLHHNGNRQNKCVYSISSTPFYSFILMLPAVFQRQQWQ